MSSHAVVEGTRDSAVEGNCGQRVKQNRELYVSHACNECRRKKVRCDGKSPCRRCITHSTSCTYDRSSRKRRNPEHREVDGVDARISDLERQLQRLSGQRSSVDGEAYPTKAFSAPREDMPQGSPESKAIREDLTDQIRPYRGPTSSEFSFQVASGISQPLQRRSTDGSSGSAGGFEIDTIVNSELLATSKPLARLIFNDPLQEMEESEVKRLVCVFNSGPGLLYPVVETGELLQTAERVFQLLRESKKPQAVQDQVTTAEELHSTKTLTLKLIIANALTLESCQVNRLAQRNFDSVRDSLGSSFWSLPSLRGIVNWILVALLHFHLDEELQASRVAAHAARLCLEMGINRRDANCTFKTPEDALLATKVVWAVFVLDRRSSIALGIPFVIQDSDLDTVLQTSDAAAVYLETMVRLSRIAGEACRLASRLSDRSVGLSTSEIDYLDYQISQWQFRLPINLQFNRAELKSGQPSPDVNESSIYMSTILFLRANQLRNLVHRPALYSVDRITMNEQYSRTAINVACEAVQILHELNSYTGLVERHPVFFKYFLVSAFSSLLLAIAKAPESHKVSPTGFNASFLVQLKQEFYTALDLFKLLGTCAPSLLHLWKSVSSLEAWANQMGLPRRSEAAGDVVPMDTGGLVPYPEMSTGQTNNPVPVIDGTWLDGWADQNDLRTRALGSVNPQLANEIWTLLDTDLDPEAGFLNTYDLVPDLNMAV